MDVTKKGDLNGMEGHGKGQKRGLGLGQDEGTEQEGVEGTKQNQSHCRMEVKR